MKKVLVMLILTSFIFTSCSVAGKNNEPAQKSVPEQKSALEQGIKAEVGLTAGKMAPDFKLKNIDGKEVKLSDYKGKTVILNFFGVWCAWCTREMPGFMKVYDDYKNKNVELVVVDNGDKLDTVINYFKENKFDVKPLMDIESKVVQQYSVSGFPTTYIINKDGIIESVHRGYMDEGVLRTVLSTLTK